MSSSGRRAGGRPGYEYPRRPCGKCGSLFGTNVIARHEKQCPDDPLIQEANRVAREKQRAKRSRRA